MPGAKASGICLLEARRLRIVFTEPDNVRIKFEAACHRVGTGMATQAFSLALNKEGRKAYTAHRRALAERFPALIPGLAAHPGIGFVVVMDDDGPVALGRDGSHRLDDGHIEGEDPLLPFGPYAPGFVRRAAHRPVPNAIRL